ncbi:MAG: hypothetical protein IT532_03345 [Burkholderiales bacterium]|nr:hypothetical protein [Burkholderiales bacterium]
MSARSSFRALARGFTLVEMIVLVIVLAVLAVVVLPRFSATRDFDTLAFHDRVLAAVRYAQKVAVAQNAAVYVVTGGNALSLCFDVGCTVALADPAAAQPLALAAPVGTTLTSSAGSFSFDGLGRPSAGPVTFTVGGTPTRTFTVEQETGHVHP